MQHEDPEDSGPAASEFPGSQMTGPISLPGSSVHPGHDAVGRVVRRWYNSSVPEIGLVGAAHWFGFACKMGTDRARLVLTIDDPAEVPSALTAATAIYNASRTMVMVDDRKRAARLDAVLRENGCNYDESTSYLALTEPVLSPAPSLGELEVSSISEADLEAWARVKLQAFADSEAPPAADAITAEVAQRSSELPLAEYQLGIFGGEPAAVLAHYPGEDDLVFILGTRTPFRHRGVARAMLGHWAAATKDSTNRLPRDFRQRTSDSAARAIPLL